MVTLRLFTNKLSFLRQFQGRFRQQTANTIHVQLKSFLSLHLQR